MNYKIQYGTTEIEFSLDRRNRKTLAIHVYPDQHVEVVAPAHVGLDKVLQKVKKRASWIYKKRLEFSRLPPAQPKPKYQTGETFRYLGRQYRLKVLAGEPSVKLKNGRFYLSAPKACIDYVIFHELCHTKEYNHSSRFYSLLSRVYPDWKKWRDYLNENIEVRIV